MTEQSKHNSYPCFGGCGTEFNSLDDMVPIPGKGYLAPRHFCPECAEKIDQKGFDEMMN